jgi:hypothetical protein
MGRTAAVSMGLAPEGSSWCSANHQISGLGELWR